MAQKKLPRICPECEVRTDQLVCPICRGRTLRTRGDDGRVDPLLGQVLEGRYRIDALIGRGGMGAVYKAVQFATGQVVAIKVIRSDLARDLEAARRFQREVKAASLLTHPHTIRIFDFGESDDGDLFMVLENLSGRTLGRVMKECGTLPEGRLAKVGCEIARSLAEAHERGLAHRDLKPDNVMLVNSVGDPDFVKVMDFGIAKFLSGDSGQSSVTGTGLIIGTPYYMAPEQASGAHGLSPAVDVYALGVILYEALSGERPFSGETPVAVMMAHIQKPLPSLPESLPISGGMRELVRAMLAKSPADRPSTVEAAELLGRLWMSAQLPERALGGTSPTLVARPVPVEPERSGGRTRVSPATRLESDGSVESAGGSADGQGEAGLDSLAPTTPVSGVAAAALAALDQTVVDEDGSVEEATTVVDAQEAFAPLTPLSMPGVLAPRTDSQDLTDDGCNSDLREPQRSDSGTGVLDEPPPAGLFKAVGPGPIEQRESLSRRRRHRFLLGVPLILGLGLLGFWWGSPGVAPPLAPNPVPSSLEAAEEPIPVPAILPPDPSPAPPPAEATPVATTEIASMADGTESVRKIRFESTPVGADVLLGANVLCRTPCEVGLEGETGSREFVFRLKGYRDARVAADIMGDDVVQVTLRRRFRGDSYPDPR